MIPHQIKFNHLHIDTCYIKEKLSKLPCREDWLNLEVPINCPQRIIAHNSPQRLILDSHPLLLVALPVGRDSPR